MARLRASPFYAPNPESVLAKAHDTAGCRIATDTDRVLGGKLAFQNGAGQRIFDLLLDSPLERPGPEHWIKPGCEPARPEHYPQQQSPFQAEPAAFRDKRAQFWQSRQYDFFGQTVEDHDFVDPVDNSGRK